MSPGMRAFLMSAASLLGQFRIRLIHENQHAQDRPEQALARIDELERLAAHAFSAGHSTHADLAGLRGVALLMLGRTDQARTALARARSVRGAGYTPEVRGDLEQVAMARSTCDAGLHSQSMMP